MKRKEKDFRKRREAFYAEHRHDDASRSPHIMRPEHGDTWGPWTYDKPSHSLWHGNRFDLDLKRSKGILLERLFTFTSKRWVTPEDIGTLMQALYDLEETA
jgi:hypothetical protein